MFTHITQFFMFSFHPFFWWMPYRHTKFLNNICTMQKHFVYWQRHVVPRILRNVKFCCWHSIVLIRFRVNVKAAVKNCEEDPETWNQISVYPCNLRYSVRYLKNRLAVFPQLVFPAPWLGLSTFKPSCCFISFCILFFSPAMILLFYFPFTAHVFIFNL